MYDFDKRKLIELIGNYADAREDDDYSYESSKRVEDTSRILFDFINQIEEPE